MFDRFLIDFEYIFNRFLIDVFIFGSIHDTFELTFDRRLLDFTHRFLIDIHFAQARWRVHNFAALWIN